jgi:hypothetical protein
LTARLEQQAEADAGDSAAGRLGKRHEQQRPTRNTRMKRLRLPLAAVALALLLIFLAIATRSRPPVEIEYDLVYSDSVPDPRAIGMCAMGRASGTLEGQIVGLVGRQGSDQHQFRIRSLANPGAEYVMDASSVQVVKCPGATGGQPAGSRGQAPQ